jgi:prevent-host-death family protein
MFRGEVDGTFHTGYSSQMKTASVTDLKGNLSAHLKEVIAGEPLLVTDRNKPVAIIQPLGSGFSSQRVAGLVAKGVVGRPGCN